MSIAIRIVNPVGFWITVTMKRKANRKQRLIIPFTLIMKLKHKTRPFGSERTNARDDIVSPSTFFSSTSLLKRKFDFHFENKRKIYINFQEEQTKHKRTSHLFSTNWLEAGFVFIFKYCSLTFSSLLLISTVGCRRTK